MPELTDVIIDEAEELAILVPNASDEEIVKELRQITRVHFDANSTCAKLGIAAYRRMSNMQMNIQSLRV